jgi:chaperonin GroES
MKIKAHNEQVLVKPLPSNKVSKGGIIVADSFLKRSDKGVVVNVGRGTKNRPMEYQKDDIVFNIRGAGVEIIEDGEKYYLIPSMDILAYIRE